MRSSSTSLGMEDYSPPTNTLIVPELTESVERSTHLCIVCFTKTVCHRMHRFPMNIQEHFLEQLAVEVQKVNGRTMHFFFHYNLFYFVFVTVSVITVTVAALAVVGTTWLFLLPYTSL